ncbi:MAG: LacI family DNA-binding transcriptional regulator [Anaerolineales bacterium]|nr:LacI family DNA-binding transcriptional regulator [Anaerolineales bacterium]
MATVKDVARHANVSIATVSRIINNQGTVSPEIRERVLAAIQALDYRPSRVARRLRTNSTFVIGLVISDIQNSFYTSLTRGVEDVASANGYSLLLCNTDEDPQRERKYLEVMHEENVAGIILASATEGGHDTRLIQASIPVVALDRVLTDVSVDTVLVDNIAGARQAVEHLISRGHRRIGAILGERPITSSIERLEGYVQALSHAGLPVDPNLIRRADLRQADDSTRCALELLNLPERPTALFTGNSLITLGTLRAIQAAGLHIPRDIALVAFDDIPWGELLNPPLTAIRQPTYQLGKTAAEMLLARIAEPDRPVTQVRLPVEFIVRASSGA